MLIVFVFACYAESDGNPSSLECAKVDTLVHRHHLCKNPKQSIGERFTKVNLPTASQIDESAGSIKGDVKSKHISSADGKTVLWHPPVIEPVRFACVIITECQTMNPKSPKASSRKSPARAGKSVQRWSSGSATKMRVFRSVEATAEQTLKIASATHGEFTFHASVRRFGLELDRQPAAYLLAVCPLTCS